MATTYARNRIHRHNGYVQRTHESVGLPHLCGESTAPPPPHTGTALREQHGITKASHSKKAGSNNSDIKVSLLIRYIRILHTINASE